MQWKETMQPITFIKINELSNINDWLKINKLALNIKKYKYMISTKAHTAPKKLELKIDNNVNHH